MVLPLLVRGRGWGVDTGWGRKNPSHPGLQVTRAQEVGGVVVPPARSPHQGEPAMASASARHSGLSGASGRLVGGGAGAGRGQGMAWSLDFCLPR